MVKKSFAKGIDAFFGESVNSIDEPRINQEQAKKEQRATFIIDVEQLATIKALAYWERKTSKLVLKEAINLFLSEKGEKYIREAIKHYRTENAHEGC